MSIIAWAARRQIQALHDAVAWSLGYVANPDNKITMSTTDLNAFLLKHCMEPIGEEHPGFPLHLSTSMDTYIWIQGGINPVEHKARAISDEASFDYGQDRAGANWSELDNFIITSAFVRLLGSIETFETDMLKALFYYRPNGLLGPEEEQIDVRANEQVVLEEPEISGETEYYSQPRIWTWIRKSAYANDERKKILSNVFGIKSIPEGYGDKQRREWTNMRNSIAHGRKRVEMTLKDYCDVEVYAIKTVDYLTKECKEKMRLII